MCKKRTSFKLKVLVPIMIIFIVSVFIISAINYRMLYQTVETKTNANLEIFINNIVAQSKHLDIILDTTKQTLADKNIAIANAVAYILTHKPEGLSIEEAQKIAELLDILELDVADAEGTIIYSNYEDGYIGWNYTSTEPTKVYMKLADGTLFEIREEPRTDEVSGDMKHYVGVSRTDDTGFIQLGFDANVLKRIQNDISIEIPINETVLGDNGHGMVLSGGIVTAHPDPDWKGRDVSGDDWYKTVSGGNDFSWVNIDNTKYYAGYINTAGNTVIGLVPEADFYKELNTVLFDTSLFMVAAIIIMIAAVYVILGKLLVPIKKLSEGLGKIGEGNFDVKIEGNYNDEFDIIKDAVNIMAVGIQSHLDGKIQAERTAHESELAKGRAEAAREAIMDSINYASKIQKNLLPSDNLMRTVFSDYSAVWKPRDVVGGDIYWAKDFYDGVLLCVADCTGHGTPGALLTMLVASTFDTTVTDKNHNDTAEVLYTLDQRLAAVLNVDTEGVENLGIMDINDGCDLAVLFIARDGSITLSAGHTNVFVCDGKETKRYPGQKIFVGEGKISGKDKVRVVNIPANPDFKYYIASDGMSDQKGGERNKSFGYKTFEKIILENHNESLSVITEKVWTAFENHRGDEQRRDDFELITFKP